MNATQPERRRYFRIDDHVRLRFEVVKDLSHLPGGGQCDTTLRRADELREIHREFNTVLNALSREQPLAARALALLNRKLDLRLACLPDSEAETAAGEGDASPRSVNLSACGVAFASDEPVQEGQLLDLRITLLPAETELRLTARVVGVEEVVDSASGDSAFHLRAEFAGQDVVTQELLISHIVQRQQALLARPD